MHRRRLLVVGLVATLLACGGDPTSDGSTTTIALPTASVPGSGAADASTPSSSTGPTVTSLPTGSGVQPVDFPSTRAIVTAADGTTCELCLWLADTVEDRARGLMSVTDLGIGDGMAFRYPAPETGTFWMRDTVLPLTIAFFAPDGSYMNAFDMEPCTSLTCLSYPTATDFLVAVEVEQGRLAELGLVEGSTLELLDTPCTDT